MLRAEVTLRPVAEDLHISASIVLPADELSWTAVRSGGPGGQNVNKLATKIELRFQLSRTRTLDDAVRERVARFAGSRVDAEGTLRIVCQETRNQARNLELARAKLAELIRRALVAPKPRKKTRKPAAVARRRLESKRRRSETKRERRAVSE